MVYRAGDEEHNEALALKSVLDGYRTQDEG
jgi:hypothetical protein